MSSGEVSLSILKYRIYKCRTENLEGDSNNKQWEEDGETFRDWEQLGELEISLTIEQYDLLPTKKYSFDIKIQYHEQSIL